MKEQPPLTSEKDKVEEPKARSGVIETAQPVRNRQEVESPNQPTPQYKSELKKQQTKKVHTNKHNKKVNRTQANPKGRPKKTNKQPNASGLQSTASLALRFSTALRSKLGKVGAGILALVVGVTSFIMSQHMNQCFDDRKKHLTEFREVVNKRRAVQEKEIQSLIAADASLNRFRAYLGQTNLTVSEIEKQMDHIAYLAGTANDDCNRFKELNYQYHTSKEILHKDLQRPAPETPPGASHQCELLARMAGKSLRPDAQKLYSDAKYREAYIAAGQEDDPAMRKTLDIKDALLSAERSSENELIMDAQIRSSSIVRRVWDCL